VGKAPVRPHACRVGNKKIRMAAHCRCGFNGTDRGAIFGPNANGGLPEEFRGDPWANRSPPILFDRTTAHSGDFALTLTSRTRRGSISWHEALNHGQTRAGLFARKFELCNPVRQERDRVRTVFVLAEANLGERGRWVLRVAAARSRQSPREFGWRRRPTRCGSKPPHCRVSWTKVRVNTLPSHPPSGAPDVSE